MQIHEVESKTRLTKKSIRYYEEQGLLSPKRNQVNDYREYSLDDVNTLKLIKFLRELNVPISDIKKLKNNEILLSEVLRDRVRKIEEEEKNYETIKSMCVEISRNGDTYQNIDISKYSSVMNVLNKGGFTMRDVSKKHQRKILGAVISSIIFSLFFVLLIIVISYFQFTEDAKAPWIVYIILMLILMLPIIGIVVNLIKRIKEIRGGEEDEASKY